MWNTNQEKILPTNQAQSSKYVSFQGKLKTYSGVSEDMLI